MSKHMRHCTGEVVDVYEVSGDVVSTLLKKAAKQVEKLEDDASFFNITLGASPEGFGETYTLTLYVH